MICPRLSGNICGDYGLNLETQDPAVVKVRRALDFLKRCSYIPCRYNEISKLRNGTDVNSHAISINYCEKTGI